MATTMRVKKGDLVQILSGKDRGKQGRVIEAYPRDGRVIVENLNIVKRHTRPKPIQSSSRMGGPQVTPGGVIDKAAPLPVGNARLLPGLGLLRRGPLHLLECLLTTMMVGHDQAELRKPWVAAQRGPERVHPQAGNGDPRRYGQQMLQPVDRGVRVPDQRVYGG